MNRFGTRILRWTAASVAAAVVSVSSVSCGGGGGAGTGDTLPGVVLVDFLQQGEDNVPLNRTLEFLFSSPLDPATVGPASIQIRQGPAFGQAIFGKYIIQGSRVFFEPALPGLCDLSDGGLQPDTDYRVTVIGRPEEFAVRNLTGDPLERTLTQGLNFHTRAETDPQLFEDQKPGLLPTVVSVSPANSTADVPVGPSNKVEIVFSENINPCTILQSTVLIQQVGVGPFSPSADQTPSDPTTWGSGTPTTPARTIRCVYDLEQDTLSTKLTLTPVFGQWPDNALILVQLFNTVTDFGGNPLVPVSFAFTTQDLPVQNGQRVFEFDGDVPVDTNGSTAEVNTARSVGRVTGFLLVSGDGDNGPVNNMNAASGPDASLGNVVGGGPCVTGFPVVSNDGVPDDFDPPADVNLSTGATRNTCKNSTDGSAAVIFEYRSFRIRSGVTVRLSGRNPAIILVRGDINIESGGRLMTRSDGGNGLTTSNGTNGVGQDNTTHSAAGVGYAGGGTGGRGLNVGSSTLVYGENGNPGYGSTNYGAASPGVGNATDPILQGAGRGNCGVTTVNGATTNRIAPSGGGGGHAAPGVAGTALGNGSTPRALMTANTDGAGGGTYGTLDGKMPTAEAGSGGGGGGSQQSLPFTTGFYYGAGGGGGAGGGFVDLTTQATIRITGTVDAQGGRGGNGGGPGGAFYGSGGGGGGGSGGGIRLLTPGSVILGAGAILNAAGGNGGSSQTNPAGGAVANNGGAGGVGRIVMEDSDSVIVGIGGATVTPADGATGFYRGVFDATRFKGGGIRPFMVSQIMDMGPFSPSYITATAADFIAGIPVISSRGVGNTSIFIEAEGFLANPDGTASNTGTGWRNVGYFTDSGAETAPNFVANAAPPAPDVASAGGLLPGNAGGTIQSLDGNEFMRMRITFFLASNVGPFDPGPYIDRWVLNFTYDQ
ncbi:MAG: Ig-like domain-containing protein [Planctomycetia bacterium]|nr:Ig-like domain-containing protein [Planctomycetia bacterium]